MAYIGQLILTILLMETILGNEQIGLQLLDNERCICPGESLTYECTVFGEHRGMTVWQGSTFNCTSREISLFHSNYETTEGSYGECGDIVGQSLRVDVNTTNYNNSAGYYVSQLTVPMISLETLEKTIECLYDDGTTSTSVEQMTITTTIGLFQPPNRLYMSNVDFVTRQLTFNWSSVSPDCPNNSIHYNILASNCGSCPTTTNHTTVICTGVPTDGTTCLFAVQTVACGNVTGNSTNPISVSVNTATQTAVTVVSDSFRIPSFTIIAVLLVIIILTAMFWFLRIIKKTHTFKHSQQLQELQISLNTNREDSGEDNGISTTIKTVDNIEMGNYSFSEENNHQQPDLTLKDEPISLSNLLQELKGQITSQWYQFGLNLGVPKDILDQLNNYSDEDRTVEILDYWLRHHSGKPTWQEVDEAKKQADLNIEDDKGKFNNDLIDDRTMDSSL